MRGGGGEAKSEKVWEKKKEEREGERENKRDTEIEYGKGWGYKKR